MNVLRDTVLVTLSSCSLLPNNLSTVPSTSTTDSKLQESGKNVFATVHRSKACLASTRLNDIRDSGDIKPPPGHIGNLLDFKEHLCLDSGARPSTALITQAAFVDIGRQNFLVITSYRGIQMYRDSEMVFWHALNKTAGSNSGPEFARGIAAVDKLLLCVGTSTGEILTFTLAADPDSSEQNKFVIGKILQSPGSTSPITDLCSVENDGRLASADENGAIVIWENSSVSVRCSCNFEDDPCNSVKLRGNVAAGGYAFGKIRLFSSRSGAMLTEIDAHAKTINAIDLSPNLILLSAGEDTFLRIWRIRAETDQIDVDLAQTHCLENMTLTGCCFISSSKFAVSAYDYSEIHVFSIQ